MKKRIVTGRVCLALALLGGMGLGGCTDTQHTAATNAGGFTETSSQEVDPSLPFEFTDSVVFMGICNRKDCAANMLHTEDGGLSIICVIDNLGDTTSLHALSNMQETRVQGNPGKQALRMALEDDCAFKGARDFKGSPQIIIPTLGFEGYVDYKGHCLVITLPDAEGICINLDECVAQLTLLGDGDSIAIQSGCTGSTGACPCQDHADSDSSF